MVYSVLDTNCICETDTYRSFALKVRSVALEVLRAAAGGTCKMYWRPYSTEFVSQLSSLFLSRTLAVESESFDEETSALLVAMLSAKLYEMRLVALRFLADSMREDDFRAVEERISNTCDEDSRPVDAMPETTALARMHCLMKTSTGRKIGSCLISMVVDEESHGECLALVGILFFSFIKSHFSEINADKKLFLASL